MSIGPRPYQPEDFALRRDDSLGLLPASRSLVIDPLNEIALLIDWQARRLVLACTFFEEELLLLLPVLRAWPSHVPYGRLLALLEAGKPASPEHEEEWTREYALAVEEGKEDELLAPLRARLAEPQKKLEIFGLRLVAVYETGILLSGIKAARIEQ